ncbi:MAG TPA: autotransporter-associated beta strand repeat-containing protein [Chthoniobacteraceae bacterium]|nr:autotransporter-associated beta strand repeat-containing protein [Chthoniobacteraceae bacterium]
MLAIGLMSLAGGAAFGANITSTFGISGTDLSIGANYSPAITVTSATTSDVVLSGSFTNGTAFTTESSTLNFGTLDDTDTTQALTIADGTITLNSAANSVGGSNAADILYVKSGANLTMNGGLEASVTGRFDVAGTVTVGGMLSGTGNITQTGGGTLVLGGVNTNSGSLTLNAGTLQLDGTAAMSTASAFTMDDNNTTLQLRADTSGTFSPASVAFVGAGAYNFDVNQLSSGTGQTLTLAGTLAIPNNSTLNVTGGNGYALGLGAVTTGAILTVNATTAGVNIASMSLPSGVSVIGLEGSGPITIGTFAGDNVTSNNTNFTLNLTGANTTIGTVAFYSNAGNNTAPDAINVTSGSSTIGSISEDPGGSGAYGVLDITVNGGTLTLSGSVTGIEYHNTSYWSLVSGTLNLNSNGAVGIPGYVFVSVNGGTLDNTSGSAVTLTANNGWNANGDFTFGGTNPLNLGAGGFSVSGTSVGVTTRTITTNGSGALTIGGALSPGSSTGVDLAKAGPGTLTLSGNSSTSFSGTTTVLAGTLIVSGSLSGGVTTVGDPENPNTAAIMEGTGLVGALTVGASAANTGATLDPGNVSGPATGTLRTGALTFSGTGANLAIQLGKTTSGNPLAGTNFNSVTTTGTLTLGGANLALTLQSGFATSGDALYFIINNTSAQTGGAANLGELSYGGVLLGQDATFTAGGQMFEISYDADTTGQTFDGTGNDVALEAVPEPGAPVLLAGCLFLFLGWNMRKRRSKNLPAT